MTHLRTYALSIMAILSLISTSARGQLLLSEGFETHTCTAGNCGTAIDGSCLAGWSRWYGSPAISSPAAPPQGANTLFFYYRILEDGEGMITSGAIASIPAGSAGDRLELDFDMFKFLANSDVAFRVYIGSGLSSNTLPAGECLQLQPNTSGANLELLGTVGGTDGAWQAVSLCHTAGIAYDQLLFDIEWTNPPSSEGTVGSYRIDQVVLNRVSAPPAPQISLVDIAPQLCAGNTVHATYKVCSEEAVTVTFDALSTPAMLTNTPVSVNVAAGSCETVSIIYTELNEIPEGGEIIFNVTAAATSSIFSCAPPAQSSFSHSYTKGCFEDVACISEGDGFTRVPGGDFSSLINQGYLLSAAASATQPQQLYFEGDVVMDVPAYTFSNDSELSFAPGVELRIASGSLLNIEFSHLQGCDMMWKGIALEQGSELYFVANTIEDAQYAIEALGNCDVSIFGNIFTNNYVGIYKAPSVDFFEFSQPFPMAANRFSMEGALLPPYPGQLPDPGQIGLAGIELHDTKFFEVGAYSLLGINEFSQLRNGIIADNATIFLINGNFDDLSGDFNPTNLSNLPEEGVGILATDRAFIDARDCEFNNMVRAVHTVDNKGLIVKDCIIEQVEDGVITLNSAPIIEYDVSDNRIVDFRQFGICLSELIGVAEGRIIGNVVISDTSIPGEYYTMSGIHLAIGANNSAAKIIEGNEITLNDSGFGIAVDNAISLQVLDNEVWHEGTASSNALRPSGGINVRESENAFLKNNTVEYNQTGDPNIGIVSGLNIIQSVDASLCCNTTDGHTYGTRLLGMMGNAEFRLTTIQDHGYGLECRNGTVISTQEHAGNRWGGSYASAAARHEGSEENISFSIFQVEPPQATDIWPTHKGIESPAAPGQWFELRLVGSAPASCAADPKCQGPPSEEMAFTPLDSLIRVGGFLGTDFGAALDWRGRQHLYHRMASNSGLHGISAEMDQFFAAESLGLIGQLDSVARGVAAIGEIGSDLDLDTKMDETWQLMEELRSLDSLFEAAATAADTMALQNTRQEMLQHLNGKLDSLNTGYGQWQQQLALKASQLLSFNSSITPGGNGFAANEQTVNNIALSLTASPNTPLSHSQKAALFSIAEQCLLEGGKAVIAARAMLLRDTSLSFTQYDDCSPVEERLPESPSMTPSISSGLSIVPNPGKENILVSWGAQPADKLEVYRINGERLAAFQLEEGSVELPISMSEYPNGLYLVRLLLQDGSTITKKLAVH